MTLQKVTDYDLQALVDNELNHADEQMVLKHLETNRDARKRYNELMKQKNILKSWWFTQKRS